MRIFVIVKLLFNLVHFVEERSRSTKFNYTLNDFLIILIWYVVWNARGMLVLITPFAQISVILNTNLVLRMYCST